MDICSRKKERNHTLKQSTLHLNLRSSEVKRIEKQHSPFSFSYNYNHNVMESLHNM
jgi:hypothetical protein